MLGNRREKVAPSGRNAIGRKPVSYVATAWQGVGSRISLAIEFTKIEIRDKTRNQSLGIIWAFAYPLIVMLFFTLVFSVVFPSRATTQGSTYVIQMLAGLVAWLPTAEILNKSTVSLESNRVLVKQIAFPTEIIPVTTVLVTFVTYTPAVTFVVVLAWVQGFVGLTLLLLPVVIALQFLFTLGLAFFLSIAGLALRDIREVIGLFVLVGLFCLPIFYQPDSVPSLLKLILYGNPGSYFVWSWQYSLGIGQSAPYFTLVVALLLTMTSLAIGLFLFKRGHRLLGDLL